MIRLDATTVHCPAKLNLTLRVHPRRSDGYHEIESLVAQLAFGDELSAVRRGDGRVTLRCDTPELPADENNLVLRAARAFQDAYSKACGADFTLTKRIPIGGGLGGGSSDAAAALRILNHLAEWPFDRKSLMEIAARVGSDIPLFFGGPTGVIRGRGEIVEPVRIGLPSHVVLLLSDLPCATADVYRAFDEMSLPLPLVKPPVVPPRLEDAAAGAEEWMEALFNDLEAPAFALYPALRILKERVEHATGLRVRMSGSGSTLFRQFDDAPAADRFVQSLRGIRGLRCVVSEFAR